MNNKVKPKMIAGLTLALMLILTLTPFSLANAQAPQAKVILDGKTVNFKKPAIVANGGSTMVAFREVFSFFGMSVDWNAKTYTVTATKKGLVIEISADKMTAKVNGGEVPLTQSAFIDGDNKVGTFYVHLRLISEATGATVGWDQKTRTVTITTTD
jgi:hypothetical protein